MRRMIELLKDPVHPTIEFASDASGNWGAGAWCQEKWWQFMWPEVGFAFKELLTLGAHAQRRLR